MSMKKLSQFVIEISSKLNITYLFFKNKTTFASGVTKL